MAPQSDRRATTHSISLTPELASEVSQRVQSGLYTSASELVREALRLLLRTEKSLARSPESHRLDEALQLHDEALALPRISSGISEQERRERIAELSLERELHPGVRLAPERTERILRGPEPEE